MDRKDFMRRLGVLSFGGALFTDRMMANMKRSTDMSALHKIGIQLFSVPSFLEKDFEGTIALLAEMGYSEIELFGPYPYSADAAKAQWSALSEMLGFSGSGYFGRTEKQLMGLFRNHGLRVPAIHTDLLTLDGKMESLGEAGDALGFTYVVLPAIPDDKRKNLDDYRRMADVFNKIGAEAKSVGLKFAYHNHGYGLSKTEGVVPLELLLDNTDPQLVFLEMDLFWTIAGRADPIALLSKYKNRYRMMHVKDMTEIMHFSGDGNDARQWMALFPNMTSAGKGAIDLKTIIPAAKKNGVKHFFVEQDLVKDPATALKESIAYLKTL